MTPPEDPAMSDPHDPARESDIEAMIAADPDQYPFVAGVPVPPLASPDADAAWAMERALTNANNRDHSQETYYAAAAREYAAIRSTGTPPTERADADAASPEDVQLDAPSTLYEVGGSDDGHAATGTSTDRVGVLVRQDRPGDGREADAPDAVPGVPRMAIPVEDGADGLTSPASPKLAALAAPAQGETPEPGLDVAWAAAEAALPKGWTVDRLTATFGKLGPWEARADSHTVANDVVYGRGPTPAAALLALAAEYARLAAATPPSAAEAEPPA